MSLDGPEERFVPALAYRWLTPFYDRVVELTARERTFKRALLDHAAIKPGMRVLDLGCGTGTLAVWAKQETPDADICGLDGDPQMLKRAREKAQRAGADVSFNEGTSFEIPFKDSSFDLVLSSLFFHHLTRNGKCKTLAEIARVLRAGAEFHVADWGRPQDPAMKLLSGSIRLLDGSEQTADNLNGAMPKLIGEAGFEQVVIEDSYRTAYGTMVLTSAHAPAPTSGKDR